MHRLVGTKTFQRTPALASEAPQKLPARFELRGEGQLKGSSLADYEILRSLGKGACADVKLARHFDSGLLVALKIYDKSALSDSMQRNSVLREIHVLESLDHPNIIKIYDCIDDGKQVVIVMEFAEGVSLHHYLGENQSISFLKAKRKMYLNKLSPQSVIAFLKELHIGT